MQAVYNYSKNCAFITPFMRAIRLLTMSIYTQFSYLLCSYDNQLLVQYNIDCGEGTLAFFNITTMDLQGDEDCSDDKGNKR